MSELDLCVSDTVRLGCCWQWRGKVNKPLVTLTPKKLDNGKEPVVEVVQYQGNTWENKITLAWSFVVITTSDFSYFLTNPDSARSSREQFCFNCTIHATGCRMTKAYFKPGDKLIINEAIYDLWTLYLERKKTGRRAKFILCIKKGDVLSFLLTREDMWYFFISFLPR